MIPLALLVLQAQPVFASENGRKSDMAVNKADIPGWAFPLVFTFMTIYVESASRYYGERRKWYLLAMAPSNLSFPWLAEHDQVPPMLTGSVFAMAVYLGCAFALLDYEELCPEPGFYIVATFFGLFISAAISATSQSGSIAGLSSGSGGNPFSIYLLFSMTMSMVICGRLLAAYNGWLDKQRPLARSNGPYQPR